MNAQRSLLTKFVVASVIAFIALCAATAWSMIRLIGWYIGTCGEGTACTLAGWTIDFWWVPFIAVVLVAALLLRQLYDRLAHARGLADAQRHLVT